VGLALAAAGAAVVLAALVWLSWSWWQSRLPDTYNVMQYGKVE
jgi:hypothetical protein